MSRDRYSYSQAHSPARPALQRAVVALLAITGVTLLVLGKTQHPALLNLRLKMLGMMEPVMEAVSQPVRATKELARSTGAVFDAAAENRQLRAENERLRHWQSVAQALKAENAALRALMAYRPVARVSYVTARVIGQSPTSFGRLLTINAGSDDGVAPLQPVTDAYGLVGRVLEAAPHSSRVLLLSDVTSRIPVVTGDSRQRAILVGTGGGMLRLNFLADSRKLKLGEPVVTTQEGALIPGGLTIGQVFRRDETGYLVKPVRPLTQSEYLRVIQIGMAPPVDAAR